MLFPEFNSDEIKQVIEDLAQQCADDNEWMEGVDLWTRVYEKAGDWCCYPIDHIKLCAYYAPDECTTGWESYEDTPFARFEGDIYDRAVEIRGGDES